MNLEKVYSRHCSNKSDIKEHLPTLRRYAENHDRVVEIGVRTGLSSIALLSGKPKWMRSYDIDVELFTPTLNKLNRNNQLEDIDYEFIRGNSLKIEIEPTDILFIDSWHTYTQLKQELIRHAPKVKRYILMHDTETFGRVGQDAERMKREKKPVKGLRHAVEEFLEGNPDWITHEIYTNNNGLYVITRVDG